MVIWPNTSVNKNNFHIASTYQVSLVWLVTDKKLEAFNKVQFNLLFDSSVKTLKQYNIIMKYEDTDTKTKVFTDQEIPKKPSGCQVRYLLRISYISRHVQFSKR